MSVATAVTAVGQTPLPGFVKVVAMAALVVKLALGMG
jgi:hypothetical protein